VFALAYTSQAVASFDDASINELALKAATKNESLGVTGYLNYDAAFETFFQFLEGEQEVVERLMAEIEQDPRHRVLNVMPLLESERQAAILQSTDVETVRLREEQMRRGPKGSAARLFPFWKMRYICTKDFRSLELDDLLDSVLTAMRRKRSKSADVAAAVMQLSNSLSLSSQM
jgi:hypothetical protein